MIKEIGNIPSEYTFGIKLLIVLYAVTPFIPTFDAIDPIGSQWLYLGLVNLFALFLVYKLNTSIGFRQVIGQHIVIYIYGAFIIVAALSMLSAINVFEGLRVLSRLVVFFIALVLLYYLLQVSLDSIIKFLVQTLLLISFLIAIQIVYHFVSNWDTPRFTRLMGGAKLLFGNRNVTSAALAMLLPFSLYGITVFTKKWKIFSFVVLFFGMSAILFVGSRSAILSSILILVSFIIVSLGANYFNEYTLSRKLKTLILPLIVSIICSSILVLNANRIEKGKSNSFANIISTFQTASELNSANLKKANTVSNIREVYYTLALNDIKSEPISGVGLGNWKLSNKDLYYKQATIDKYRNPARTHNDFLQIMSETGIVGGLLFLSFFLVLGYPALKSLWNSKSKIKKSLVFVLLLSLVAYGIDANLNFPLERAPIQAFLLIVVATLIAGIFQGGTLAKGIVLKYNTIKIAVLAVVNIGMVFVLYSGFKSYVEENYVLADSANKDVFTSKYAYTYDQVKGKLSSLFDLTSGIKPVDHYLAIYAMSEGNDKLALSHLDKAIKIAPNQYESKGLKTIIYGKRKKNLDSAIFYAKEGFEKYPAIKNNYVVLLDAYREKRDTTAYFNTYDTWLANFPNDISQWKAKAERLYQFYKDENLVIETIDKGIKRNPSDESLRKFRKKYLIKSRSEDIRKWYKNGFAFIKQKGNIKAKKEFLKILEITPSNSATLLNLGIIEIKMGQYEEAIAQLSTIIEAQSFKDGKPEYNRALAYEKTGNIELARKDYKKSKSLGYKLAQNLPKNKLE